MPIEVEAPDGTVIEFPDGTAPETIKGVMAKQFGGPSATAETSAPPVPQAQAPRSIDTAAMQAEYQKALGQGWDANQIGEWLKSNNQQFDPAQLAAAVEFRRKNPNVPLDKYALNVETPGFFEGLPKAAEDFATNVTKGFYSGIDMLANVGDTIGDAAANTGLALVDPFVRNFSPGAANSLADLVQRGNNAPNASIGGYLDSQNSGAKDQPGAGLQQFFGAALFPVPAGKATAPKFGYNALARAEDVATAPAQNALASAATKDIGLIPNAEKVIAAGKENAIPVMRSDVKPPTTRFGQGMRMVGENIWLAGTGGKRAAQQRARVEAVERIAREYGADDLSNIGEAAQNATNAVTKAFAERRAKELGQLTATKQQVLEGVTGAVETPRAIAEIDRQIARLNGINSEAFAPVVAKLESFKGQLSSGKNLAQIEGNRKLLGDLFADPSLASIKGDGQKALNAIYGPLREDMTAFIKANAGEGVAARFKNANDRLAAMAGELSDAKFKRVLKTADASPEEVAKLIFSKKPSDVTRLFANLDDAGKAKAEAAIVLEAVKRATTDGAVSPQKFATAMEAMKNATRLMAGSEKAARLEGLSRVLKATQHASEAAAFPITGAQLTPMAATGGLVTVLGQIGLGSATLPVAALAGIAARLYENKIPAQLLGQLGKVKPGSKAEATIGAKLAPHIAKLLPVAANDTKPMPMSPGAAAAQGEEPQN